MLKISAAKRSNVSEMKLALSRCTIQDPHGGRGDIGTLSSLIDSKRRSSTGSTSTISRCSSSTSGRQSRHSTSSITSSSTSLSSRRSSISHTNSSLLKSQEIKRSLHPDIQKKVGNRQLKTINENSKKCASCSKPLTDDGFFALGKLFHKNCFRCKYCSVKLSQIYFVRDDAAVCSKCHKENIERCWVCKNKIIEDHISCNKKFYHPGCMKCYICGEILRERFLTFKDQPICEKDYKNIGHVCTTCQNVIIGEVYIVDNNYYCEKDFETLIGNGNCSKCGDIVSPDDSLAVGTILFHHSCLRCTICNKNMEGQQVTLDKNNKVYCAQDYDRMFCSKCAVCNKAIVPRKGETKVQKLRALGKDFHLQCFKCEDCSLVLKPGTPGKECWPIKNHILCYKCNTRRQDESERESD